MSFSQKGVNSPARIKQHNTNQHTTTNISTNYESIQQVNQSRTSQSKIITRHLKNSRSKTFNWVDLGFDRNKKTNNKSKEKDSLLVSLNEGRVLGILLCETNSKIRNYTYRKSVCINVRCIYIHTYRWARERIWWW